MEPVNEPTDRPPAPPVTADAAPLRTHQKAFQINLDPTKYGSLAEIGAGQEVARWFFRVGGAAGTIAKSMSAYDMAVSDDIYGKVRRYVSRQRLQAMLDHEYALMEQRLSGQRGGHTRFFAFADTVVAQSYHRHDDCHGWMGIRYQTQPAGPGNDIILHVRLLDHENLQQQEALGIVGVNLIYGALYLHEDPPRLIRSLVDNLSEARVEVDLIQFSGPAFAAVDNRLMSLQLVQHGLASAAMLTAEGEVVQPSEVLYKKAILAERGSFRPITNATLDLLRCAQAQYTQEAGVAADDLVVLLEMTLSNLTDDGTINHRDFLDRADLITTLGRPVLISNFAQHYKLGAYLQRHTQQMIGLAMGLPTLREIFNEKYYADLEGGILESFGRLFKNALKLFVYPYQDESTGRIITVENLEVAPHLRHLYRHLCDNRCIQSLQGYDPRCLQYYAQHVLGKIQTNDSTWQTMVPEQVSRMIRERQLFNYPGT